MPVFLALFAMTLAYLGAPAQRLLPQPLPGAGWLGGLGLIGALLWAGWLYSQMLVAAVLLAAMLWAVLLPYGAAWYRTSKDRL